ncbi:MAG: sigma-70 family RNA polymerase sigma factor [Acidimicrobiales bacterium]|nr:sigma-70 family RNA polymerase sigma factor [Acidimicrobiales bacterium]
MAGRTRDTSDAALVELVRRDPAVGWAAIWDTHGAALHGYCRRLLDDSADADDVVADVFLVASQRLDQLRDPDALRAWLFSISRRSVQRRWRARSRTVPVDPHGAAVMSHATDTSVDELSSVGASDAGELVDAASAGLSVEDRELLALTLGADLDTAEVARITGQKQSAVSVRVTRLKDTVARAAGALLVARHHRRDCDVLDDVLASWDGAFDPLWRKRIARHVEGCDTCDERRRGAVAAFASPLLLAPAPHGLRERVLSTVEAAASGSAGPSASAATESMDDDGFPAAERWPTPTRRRPALAVAAAVVLVMGAVVAGIALWGGDGTEVAAIAAPDLTSIAPTTSSTLTTTTEPQDPALVEPVDQPTDGTTAPTPTIVTPPPAPPPVPPPTPPSFPSPTVSVTVDPDTLTSCGSSTRPTTATVVVGAGAGSETTTVSWDGGSPGSVEVAGAGDHEIEVGPFEREASGPISQTIVVTASTLDAVGGSAVDTHEVTIEVVPC